VQGVGAAEARAYQRGCKRTGLAPAAARSSALHSASCGSSGSTAPASQPAGRPANAPSIRPAPPARRPTGNVLVVVVAGRPAPHPVQHVHAHGGVVHVAGHLAARQPGKRVRERPAGGVDEHLRGAGAARQGRAGPGRGRPMLPCLCCPCGGEGGGVRGAHCSESSRGSGPGPDGGTRCAHLWHPLLQRLPAQLPGARCLAHQGEAPVALWHHQLRALQRHHLGRRQQRGAGRRRQAEGTHARRPAGWPAAGAAGWAAAGARPHLDGLGDGDVEPGRGVPDQLRGSHAVTHVDEHLRGGRGGAGGAGRAQPAARCAAVGAAAPLTLAWGAACCTALTAHLHRPGGEAGGRGARQGVMRGRGEGGDATNSGGGGSGGCAARSAPQHPFAAAAAIGERVEEGYGALRAGPGA
jgi:hypothetical protein